MNELGSFGASSAMQGRYEIRDDAPVQVLASELFPVVQMSDSLMDPELHFESRPQSRLCIGFANQPAVAGQFSHVHITNPPNSGVIGIVTAIEVKSEFAAAVVIGIEGGVLTVAATQDPEFTRDSRWGSAGRTVLQCGTHASAVRIGDFSVGRGQTDSAGRWVFPGGSWVLGPQSRLILSTVNAAQVIEGCFYWRERRIESGELRGAT